MIGDGSCAKRYMFEKHDLINVYSLYDHLSFVILFRNDDSFELMVVYRYARAVSGELIDANVRRSLSFDTAGMRMLYRSPASIDMACHAIPYVEMSKDGIRHRGWNEYFQTHAI